MAENLDDEIFHDTTTNDRASLSSSKSALVVAVCCTVRVVVRVRVIVRDIAWGPRFCGVRWSRTLALHAAACRCFDYFFAPCRAKRSPLDQSAVLLSWLGVRSLDVVRTLLTSCLLSVVS